MDMPCGKEVIARPVVPLLIFGIVALGEPANPENRGLAWNSKARDTGLDRKFEREFYRWRTAGGLAPG